MARMGEEGILGKLMAALEGEDVPLHIRDNLQRYFIEASV
jgi:hypothetical protein